MNVASKHTPRAGRRRTAALLIATLVAGGIVTSANDVAAAPAGDAKGIPSATAAAPRPDGTDRDFVPGVVLVGYDRGVTAAARTEIRAEVDSTPATGATQVAPSTELVKLEAGTTVAEAVAELSDTPGVRYAEPDYRLHASQQSDDELFRDGRLWGMYGDATSPTNQYGSGAAEAWAQGRVGSRDIYIGVIDEGVQVGHPDLAANTWTNPADPADGVDNDGNGYVDDTRGWDFINDNNTVYDGNDVEGSDRHGTHVSGTIAGVGGNGTGVAGVNWQATIIPAKFLGPNGGSTSDAVEAVDYLTDLKLRHGINIVASSNSWGGGGYSQALLDAIERGGDAGILFVAAAGNYGSDNDGAPHYPANYECTKGGTRGFDCVVSVAALEGGGGLASFSDFGATTVDLGAAGQDVWSTVPGGYESFSGTSMATPHVSGAIALCASVNPAASAAQLRNAVLDTTMPTPSLAGRTTTGGRLDIGAAMNRCDPPSSPVIGKARSLRVTSTSIDTVNLSWTDGAEHEEQLQIQRAPSLLGLCGRFQNAGAAGANATSAVVSGLDPATRHCFRIRATNSFGGGSVSKWSNVAQARTTRDYVCRSEAYAWTDPTVGGTNLLLGDDTTSMVALPFPVSLYGTTTSSIGVSSNGLVRFDGGSATTFENAPIPSTTDPNNFAAPFWDDLNPAAGGGVWVRTVGAAPNRKVVVGWIDVPHFGIATGSVSFELVLTEGNGGIVFRYRDTEFGDATVDRAASATAGIENSQGTRGRQLALNTAVLAPRTAYRCSTDPFRLLGATPRPANVTIHPPKGS
jgi:thermitase